jgi:hypothetical protein
VLPQRETIEHYVTCSTGVVGGANIYLATLTGRAESRDPCGASSAAPQQDDPVAAYFGGDSTGDSPNSSNSNTNEDVKDESVNSDGTATGSPIYSANPFLHLWSLGVEEQFYLLFPFTYLFLPAMSQSKMMSEDSQQMSINSDPKLKMSDMFRNHIYYYSTFVI